MPFSTAGAATGGTLARVAAAAGLDPEEVQEVLDAETVVLALAIVVGVLAICAAAAIAARVCCLAPSHRRSSRVVDGDGEEEEEEVQGGRKGSRMHGLGIGRKNRKGHARLRNEDAEPEGPPVLLTPPDDEPAILD